MKPKSSRYKLGVLASTGQLRYWLEAKMDQKTLDLLVDIAIRYCETRRKEPKRTLNI